MAGRGEGMLDLVLSYARRSVAAYPAGLTALSRRSRLSKPLYSEELRRSQTHGVECFAALNLLRRMTGPG